MGSKFWGGEEESESQEENIVETPGRKGKKKKKKQQGIVGKDQPGRPSKGVLRYRETKADIVKGAQATLFGGARKKSKLVKQ